MARPDGRAIQGVGPEDGNDFRIAKPRRLAQRHCRVGDFEKRYAGGVEAWKTDQSDAATLLMHYYVWLMRGCG